MAVAENERQALVSEDQLLQDQQTALEAAARSGALDEPYLQHFTDTFKELAARLKGELLPRLEPEVALEVQGRLLSVLTMRLGERDVLDYADELLMEVEAVRHVVRDALQEQPRALLQDARAVAGQLEAWLPGLSQRELAALLGMSARTYQRHREQGGEAGSREQTVLRLVAILRRGWSDAGVLAWFERPRLDLDGAAPLGLLGDPAREQQLLGLARGGRVQGA